MMRLVNVVAATVVLFALFSLMTSSFQGTLSPVAHEAQRVEGVYSPQAAALGALGLTITPEQALGYQPSELSHLRDAHPVAPSMPITLGITLVPRDAAGLAQVASGGDPNRFLTSTGFVSGFAPAAQSYSSVEASLVSSGFTLTHTYKDRMFILAHGNVGEAERLFSTRLVEGSVGYRSVILPAAPPILPGGMAPFVLSVSGLSQDLPRFHVDSSPLATPSGSRISPNYPHFMYGVDDLYNLTGGPHWATGMRIGLLLWGDGYAPSDMTTFAQTLYPSNEPPFSIVPVPLDGAPAPSPGAVFDPSGTPFELTLDMEWSESQAPGATLVPVYVPDGPAANGYSPSDTDMEDGLAYLVNSAQVNVISMSFGSQDGSDIPFQTSFDTLFQTAAAQGISVFASSGDNGGAKGGSLNSCGSTPETQYPASSPWVTAVGGTAPVVSLSPGGSGSDTLSSDAAWPGSTGGFSPSYTAPSWQMVGSAGAAITSEGNGQRGIPDVSGPSSYNGLYYNSSLGAGAGTSFASPMWAGIVAEMVSLHGTGFGLIDPALYRLGVLEDRGTYPAPYNDVTQGSNCFYAAVAGWDAVTGWGTPKDALTVYGDLINGLVTLGVSVNPAVMSPGGSATVTVTATNSTGAPVSGLSVTVTIYSHPDTTNNFKVLSTISLTTDSSGSKTGSFKVPLSYAYSQILVKAGTFSATAVGSATLLVKVSALATYWGPLGVWLSWPYDVPFFLLLLGIATFIGWFLGRRKATPAPARGPEPSPVPPQKRVPVRTAATPARPSAPMKPAVPSSLSPAGRPTPVQEGARPSSQVHPTPTPRAPVEPITPEPEPSPLPSAPVEEPSPDEPWTGIASYSMASPAASTPPDEPETASPAEWEEETPQTREEEPVAESGPGVPQDAEPTEPPTVDTVQEAEPSLPVPPEPGAPSPEPPTPEEPVPAPIVESVPKPVPQPPVPTVAPRRRVVVRKRAKSPPPPAPKPRPAKRKPSKP